MPVINRNKLLAEKKFENNNNVKSLILFITIVNFGQSKFIENIFQNCKASASFVQLGTGTANREALDILGIENNGKDVIYSIVSEDKQDEIKKELAAFFVMNKKTRGITMTIKLDSMIGVTLYKFFTNTL